jgi:hypothetical protein
LRAGNLNATIEAPVEARIQQISGQAVLKGSYFSELPPGSILLLMGQGVVEPDVEPAALETSLTELIVLGQLMCPVNLLASVQARARLILGQVIGYEANARPIMGDYTLDRHGLEALADASDLVLLGRLTLPEVVPDDLIERKLGKVAAFGGVLCHEENARALRSRLDVASGDVTVIPAGHTLMEQPVMLNAAVLRALPAGEAARLYGMQRIEIAADVDVALLDSALERLACADIILCPQALQETLARKCNLLENRVVFYEGALWKVDGEQTLRAARFEYLEGRATLVVFGELTVDADVEPRLLADRLARVHNFGEIRCTPQQMSALEARLGLNEGELKDSTASEAKPSAEFAIENANYLAL